MEASDTSCVGISETVFRLEPCNLSFCSVKNLSVIISEFLRLKLCDVLITATKALLSVFALFIVFVPVKTVNALVNKSVGTLERLFGHFICRKIAVKFVFVIQSTGNLTFIKVFLFTVQV